MTESRPVAPRPAATMALLRARQGGGVEVFMVRRHVQSEFAPDVFVFPGGSVQPDDREIERTPSLAMPVEVGVIALGSGFRVAALRECFEEAGVLLAYRRGAPLALGPDDVARYAAYRQGLQERTLTLGSIVRSEELALATDSLVHWAHWITPEALPKRFDTHFFLAEMPPQQQAAADQLETTEDSWIQPEEALSRYAAGTFPLVFATIHQLRALTGLASVAAARERFAGTAPRTIMPTVAERDGAPVILLPDDMREEA